MFNEDWDNNNKIIQSNVAGLFAEYKEEGYTIRAIEPDKGFGFWVESNHTSRVGLRIEVCVQKDGRCSINFSDNEREVRDPKVWERVTADVSCIMLVISGNLSKISKTLSNYIG